MKTQRTMQNQLRAIKRRLRKEFGGHCRATDYHGSRVAYHALHELKFKYYYHVIELWERTGNSMWRFVHVY